MNEKYFKHLEELLTRLIYNDEHIDEHSARTINRLKEIRKDSEKK